MDKLELISKAMQVAGTMLKTIFIEQDPQKARELFSVHNSSWIGWSKEAFVPSTSTFWQSFKHKYPRPLSATVLEQAKWQPLYADEQLCLIYCQFDIPDAEGSAEADCSRFTFMLAADGDDVRLLHLHSSLAWKFMQNEEVYPHQYATLFFHQLEKQQGTSSAAAFAATNTPNGIKLCKIQQQFPAIYVNKALCTIAGYSSMTEMLQATQGQLKRMIYHKDIPKVTQAMLSHQNGTPYSINYRLLHKKGITVWVLERGQYIVDELTSNEFFICSVTPLELEQERFVYGALIDYNTINEHKIPIELFIKTALQIISTNQSSESIRKLLKMACDVLQADGTLLYDLHSKKDKLLIHAQYTVADGKLMAKEQNYTPEEILSHFDHSDCSKCSSTQYLPEHYRHYIKAADIQSMISQIVRINGEPAYIVSAYHRQKQHAWSANESEIMQQLAKFMSLVLLPGL